LYSRKAFLLTYYLCFEVREEDEEEEKENALKRVLETQAKRRVRKE